MLRIHFMQQWFTLSDPAMEEALHDVPLFRQIAQLVWDQRFPDETTILKFRHLLEKHKLAEQILATINAEKAEKITASARPKVERPFRVIKRQFGHVKVRYRGLAKNTAQLKTLFALCNLWMVREKLLELDEVVSLKAAVGA
jgi:IS5 family transposase